MLFPAQRRITYDLLQRDFTIQQQIWVIDGKLDIQLGAQPDQLNQGDDLAIDLEHPIIFSNLNAESYRYVLAIEDRKIPYNMHLTPAWNLWCHKVKPL